MRRVLPILAGVAVALAVAVTGALLVRPTEPPAIEIGRTAAASYSPSIERGVVFVLVIGSDVREGDPRGGRADTLQILALNTETGHGTLVGIPRDSYVPIPGRGSNKINAALFFGGPELQTQTVAEFTGLPIHYWAMVEFSRFRNLVDDLGGVEVDVPYPMSDRLSGAFFDPGPRHMNGAEALAFSRNRQDAPGGDFGRSANAGRLLIAGAEKFREEAASPAGLARYLMAFRNHVQANVGVGELLELAFIARGVDPQNIESVVAPGSTGSAGGASVVFLGQGAQDIFNAIRDDGVL